MKLTVSAFGLAFGLLASSLQAADIYGPFPVTVKGYSGDKIDSTAYSGQAARHLLHNSLKVLAGQGNGEANPELKAKMMAYYAGKDAGREILDPVTHGNFVVEQTRIDQVSAGNELKTKTYQGVVNGWPGSLTGSEVIEQMIDRASAANGGFDPLTGYDYPQLISKFIMGAVFYHQAVEEYLGENLQPGHKPNGEPYQPGAYYTGKEHSWDEAFGYFGAPAHALTLNAIQAYNVARGKDMQAADYNRDGVVDLYREMAYAHAYYSADADKSGTNYLHRITRAFIDGRELIAGADGENLNETQRAQLTAYAETIKSNWEKVIAEAAFKYAGEVYQNLQELDEMSKSNADPGDAFREYCEHWSEMKGFAMALETGSKNLGAVGARLNRLIGYGPVLFGGGQVTALGAQGEFVTGGDITMTEYMVNMIEVQKLLGEEFGLQARKDDVTGNMSKVLESTGGKASTETD
ncbi:MAG: DUF4856 domain-containing protein [Gammaproteobacteria bacterium]|jgi:hypothetical protein